MHAAGLPALIDVYTLLGDPALRLKTATVQSPRGGPGVRVRSGSPPG